jgi:hypothetical protein
MKQATLANIDKYRSRFGTMRYVKNAAFVTIDGTEFELALDNKPGYKATIGDMLALSLKMYKPATHLGQVFTLQEQRYYNKAWDKLDFKDRTNQPEYLEFDDSEMEVLQKLVSWVFLVHSPRNAPKLADILTEALTETSYKELTKKPEVKKR